MNTIKSKLIIGLFVLTLGLPFSTSAYETTNQTATKLNANTILYTITYKFGFLNREMLMPIIAATASTSSDFPLFVKYTIEDNQNNPVTTGTSKAIVLTNDEDATIKNGQYHLATGRAAEFTLIALFTLPESELAKDQDLSLKIKSLPFTIVNKREAEVVELNDLELADYRTPAINL